MASTFKDRFSNEGLVAFRTRAAAMGLPFDDPSNVTDIDKLLELRNACRKVASAISEKAFSEQRDHTPEEISAMTEITLRVGHIGRNIDIQKHAQDGTFPEGSIVSPPAGMTQEDWTAMIRSAPGYTGSASASRPAASRFVDMATGKPIPVIDKFDNRASIAKKLGVSGSDPGYGIGDFLRGVAGMGGGNRESMLKVRNAMSEGTNSAGGYLVPNVLVGQVMDALRPASTLLDAGVPILMLPEGGQAFNIAQITALPTAAFRSEGGAVAASDPTLGVITLTPRSLAFQFSVSRELLMDASNLSDVIMRVIAQAIAVAIDNAGLRGSGTPPNPQGILNNASVNAVTNGTNGATQSSLKWTNIISAMQAILTANAPIPTNAIMAPRSLTGFSSLVDTTGQPLRRPDMVLPMKFAATSAIPVNLTVGSSSDCTELYIGDFAHTMLFGMRETLTIIRADQLNAATGQITFFGHSRVDVGIYYPQGLAKVTGVRAN